MPCLLLLALLWWTIPVLAEGFVCAGSQGATFGGPVPADAAAKPARIAASTTGTRRALVLFARFKGEPANPVPSWTTDIFNPDLPGSFSHFYDTMSFGKLQVRGEVAPRAYESSQPASAYLADDQSQGDDFGQFSLEVLRLADQDIDFAQFDNDGPDGIPNSGDDDGVVDAMFLVLDKIPEDFLQGEATGISRLGLSEAFPSADVGKEGKPIQVLASQGTIQQGRYFAEAVGAMCHEYGHVLGLPDLYNTDFIAAQGAGPEKDSAGVGAWCLMGWGASGWNGNDGPNSFCAWSRTKLGWSQVLEVKQAQQDIRLEQVGKKGRVVRVPLTGQEYFLLEYRKRDSSYYDRNLPGEGLLVWHISRRPDQGEQYPLVVDLECADGRWQDAGYPLGKSPDPQGGGDNLDFWAHDAAYTRTHGGNLGDATDLFDGVRFIDFTPQTNPASFSEAGTLSARIEHIKLEANAVSAQVQTSPLKVEISRMVTTDKDGDGLALAGEQLGFSFQLANTGGLDASDLVTRLRTDDPSVEILRAETHFPDLGVGKNTLGVGTDAFLAFRFTDAFVGTHKATLVLEAWSGAILVDQREIEMTGISPRQIVRRVTVVDTLGNGDGLAQQGEFIGLELELENVTSPESLRRFGFFLRPLEPGVEELRGSQFQLVAAPGQLYSQRSPEFLLPAPLEPGSRLEFEFEAQSGYSAWKDTFAVEVHPGPDQTPPHIQVVQTQPVDGGVLITLPEEEVFEGGEVKAVEAHVFSVPDTSLLAAVPLRWQGNRYEGKWSASSPGTYLIRVLAEDGSGNLGQSHLQGFLLLAGATGSGNPEIQAWEEVRLPGEGYQPSVARLVLAPSNPEVMYGSSSQGTWRSVDGGKSWERMGLMWDTVILVDAVEPFTIYANPYLVGGHSLKSRDGGMTWQVLDTPVALVAADPVRSGRVYGYLEGHLAISENQGESWTRTEVEAGGFVAVQPLKPQNIYTGQLRFREQQSSRIVPGDMWRSADGGHTWEQQRLAHLFNQLIADVAAEDGLYATGQDTIFHSADRGRTWEARGVIASQNPVMSLVMHPRNPRLLYAWPGTYELWRSRDAGQSWEQLILPQYQGVDQVILHPSDPHRVIVLTGSFTGQPSLLYSRDDTETWGEVNLPMNSSAIGTVMFDPGGRVYVGAAHKESKGSFLPRIYIGDDQQHRWEIHGEVVGKWGGFYVSGAVWTDLLHIDDQQPQIWIAGLNGIFERSEDGGRNWEVLEGVWGGFGSIDPPPVLVADPRQAGVYYLTAAGAVLRSTDFGESWEERSPGRKGGIGGPSLFGGLVMDPTDVPTLYVAYQEAIWRSRDEGLHWENLGGPGGNLLLLTINPLDSQRLYAATREGLVVSTNRGLTWSLLLVNPGKDLPARMRLRFDPRDPARMLWITGPQLLETRDGGKTWASLSEGLTSVPGFNDAAIDPARPQMVYAATPWGVYRLDTSRQVTAVEETAATPVRFALVPNYPNPFNPTTTLRFTLPQLGEAELAIYNLLGQRVATLVRGVQEAGTQVLQWNGQDDQGRALASGVYVYRLQAGAQVESRKLLLLR